jgi:hypothetical protein
MIMDHYRFGLRSSHWWLASSIRAPAFRTHEAGRLAYGWTLLTDSGHRSELFRAGWKDVGRLFVAAVIIDMVYEIIVFRWIYPGQALIVAVTCRAPRAGPRRDRPRRERQRPIRRQALVAMSIPPRIVRPTTPTVSLRTKEMQFSRCLFVARCCRFSMSAVRSDL